MVWPLSLIYPDGAPGDNAVTKPSPEEQTRLEAEAAEKHRLDSGMPSKEDAQRNLAALLAPFEEGASLPPTARTRPGPQHQEEPMTITKLWRYIPFLTAQSASLTKAFVSHHVYGPPKPSWGVELTLFTTFLREAASYSHLSSLTRLRSVLDLGTLLPTPKDGIVTPVTFRVKRRGLRGFLAEADSNEDGRRILTGEWVINKRLWKKMQTEFALNKSVCKDRVILYLHGGAYYALSAETHRLLTISTSRYTESRVFALNYRLAPETRFPGQLHDAVSAYMRLIVDLNIPPENIIIAGDSAGGGLCLATMMYLRDEGYTLPSGAILASPWVDLSMSCDSWTTNRPFDYVPTPQPGDHLNPVLCLLGDNVHRYLTHPYVSPLFGNFKGLPPMLIQAGDAEVLRDEITLLAHKAAMAGVPVEHELFEDCPHVFQAFLFLEASRKAFQSQRHFVKYKLPTLKKPSEVDLAQMDAEISADAHTVDDKGHAAEASLPQSPAMTSSTDLPEEDEDEEDDDTLDSTPPVSAQPSPRAAPNGADTPVPPTYDTDLGAAQEMARPLLRAYASARDLLKSKSLSPPEPSRRHHRSNTISVRFEHRDDVQRSPQPHARAASHPDFTLLLAELAEHPVIETKVYFDPTGSEVPPLVSPSVKSRSRSQSIAGESLGFSFV